MSGKISIISVFCSSLLLSACDSDNIKEVKSVVNYNIDSSLTLGKAFETRSDCHDGVWSEEKDERGRAIVSYSCILPERGLLYINNQLMKNLNSSVSTSNEINDHYVKSLDNDIKVANNELASLDKLSTQITKAASDLNNAFLHDDFEYLKLSYRSYLATLLYIAHKGKDTVDINKLCNDFYDHYEEYYALDMHREDAAGAPRSEEKLACNKHIYPILVYFIEHYFETSPHIYYNLTEELAELPSNYELSDEDVLKAIDVKIQDRKIHLNEWLEKLPKRREVLTANLSNNLNIQNNAASELSVKNMKIQYNWIVSATGGVESIDGLYILSTSNDNLTKSVSGEAIMPFAYIDYKENEFSKTYANAAIGMMGYIYSNITGQLKS